MHIVVYRYDGCRGGVLDETAVNLGKYCTYGLFHRFRAAFWAISDRFFLDRDAARAFPPFDAPSLDRATAAGFRVSGSSGGFGSVAERRMWAASCTGSRGGFFGLLARAGIATA